MLFVTRFGLTKNSKVFISLKRCLSSDVSSEKIGFIGLGNMGGHMVNNLLKTHPVAVFDLNKEALKVAEHNGASVCSSVAEVSSKVRTLITMLPASSHVKQVYQGEDGVLKNLSKGSLLIDCSTIDIDVSKTLAKEVQEAGSVFIDAPVSGGVTGAKDGTLTFMVGGDEGCFEKSQGILKNMGANVVYCGASGSGQATKICNNMILGITMIGTAEAMLLSKRLGLDPKLFSSILNISSGQSWSSLKYNPCPGVIDNIPASRNYEGGFGCELMLKDLGLAQNSSTSTSTATPMGALALQFYKLACANGYGKKDFAAVYRFLEGLSKDTSK